MLSSQTKGVIKKVIALSGSMGGTWRFTPPDVAISKSKQIAEFFQCPTNSSALLVECLRRVPASQLLSSLTDDVKLLHLFFPHGKGHLFAPTIETEHPEAFLTEHPLQVLEQGRAQKIPFLTGVNADDGLVSAFSFYGNPQNMKTFEDNWEDRISHACNLTTHNRSRVAKSIKDFYFPPNKTMTYNDKLEGFKNLFGDCFFNFDVHRGADIQRRFSPVYLYFYNIRGGPSLTSGLTNYKDVFHPLVDYGLSFAIMYFKEILLGIPREDTAVGHFDDMMLAFPIMTTIRRGHEFYNLSKSFVKFLADFAVDERTSFKGEELEPVPEKGPMMYLDISKQPRLISPEFVSRFEFLRSRLEINTYFKYCRVSVALCS
ncbi:unnamed protein product [Allacma fusca]|nr:unnamed protein product [Allacma fusca]